MQWGKYLPYTSIHAKDLDTEQVAPFAALRAIVAPPLQQLTARVAIAVCVGKLSCSVRWYSIAIRVSPHTHHLPDIAYHVADSKNTFTLWMGCAKDAFH